jgi:hypothetical protein
MKTKAKVKLDLSHKTVDNKIESARTYVISMTGNANFPSPNPALSIISSATNDLETANAAAKDGGKSKVAAMYVKEKILDDLITQLGHYVEATANGDASVILSSGMKVKNANTSTLAPQTPEKLTATASTTEGEVKLSWKISKGTKVYVVEQNNDATLATNNWVQVDMVTKTKITLTGLNSGQKYAFRVYAVGSGGKSAYSQVVMAKAF